MTDAIYFDLTTSYHFNGTPTGVPRVEQRAYKALVDRYGDRVIAVAWNSRSGNLVTLPQADAAREQTLDKLSALEEVGRSVRLETAIPDSLFIVVGTMWTRHKRYVDALIRLKLGSSVRMSLLVHDLTPLKVPHLYEEPARLNFETGLRNMSNVVDNFLCYSRSTRDDLAEYHRSISLKPKEITNFALGDMTDEFSGSGENPVIGASLSIPFFLYVSSIDPRKNHKLLLDVWRELIAKRGASAPHLVFVGRPIWQSDEVTGAIESDQILSPFVHLFPEVNDAELDWFYRNCLMTLYPSLYEGCGLPIAESLSYGKACIASDASSTKEVSPFTDLASPTNVSAWVEKIEWYLENPSALEAKQNEIKDGYRAIDWKEAVGQIVGAIETLPIAEDGLNAILSELPPPPPPPLLFRIKVRLAPAYRRLRRFLSGRSAPQRQQ